MAENPNNIAKIRKLRGLSQQALAERVGAHTITISNLERGQAPLTNEWTERLSEALHVHEAAFLKSERPLKVFVGAELSADYLHYWEIDFPIDPELDKEFAVAVAETPRTVPADIIRWAVVRNDSLYPVFRANDVVRLIHLSEDNEDDLAWAKDRLCVVGGLTSDDKSYVGYLSSESTVGQLKINCIVGPPVTIRGETNLHVIDRAIYQPNFRKR